MVVSIITYELIRSVVVSILIKQLDFLQFHYIKEENMMSYKNK
ncbi:hypothetical protein [Flavobacterium sp. LB2P53]|nr:hypothetical protein [Flavobacterium sp. LB2P53]